MLKLTDYDIFIPSNLIALHPPKKRDLCKLLYYNKCLIKHTLFKDIFHILNKDDILVINDTKVDPIRLYCKSDHKMSHEVLVLIIKDEYTVECKIRGRRKLPIGIELSFQENIKAILLNKLDDDNNLLQFNTPIELVLEKLGELPLPQYIISKRPYSKDDQINYQTIFANDYGSKAAPTAGLHFSNDLLEKLITKGVIIVPLQLFVSLGTFDPIKSEDIKNHSMHFEEYEIKEESASILNKAIEQKRKIIAVGTTSLRALEASFDSLTNQFKVGRNKTNLFITPGYKVRTANALITNFHTPKSTLLVLVASLIGYDKMIQCYKDAIKKEYQFFSYGDACFFDNIKNNG